MSTGGEWSLVSDKEFVPHVNPNFPGGQDAIGNSVKQALAPFFGFGEGQAGIDKLNAALASGQTIFTIKAHVADSKGFMSLGSELKDLQVDLKNGIGINVIVAENDLDYPVNVTGSGVIYGVTPEGQLVATIAFPLYPFKDSENNFKNTDFQNVIVSESIVGAIKSVLGPLLLNTNGSLHVPDHISVYTPEQLEKMSKFNKSTSLSEIVDRKLIRYEIWLTDN